LKNSKKFLEMQSHNNQKKLEGLRTLLDKIPGLTGKRFSDEQLGKILDKLDKYPGGERTLMLLEKTIQEETGAEPDHMHESLDNSDLAAMQKYLQDLLDQES
jgi:hypothetical protein